MLYHHYYMSHSGPRKLLKSPNSKTRHVIWISISRIFFVYFTLFFKMFMDLISRVFLGLDFLWFYCPLWVREYWIVKDFYTFVLPTLLFYFRENRGTYLFSLFWKFPVELLSSFNIEVKFLIRKYYIFGKIFFLRNCNPNFVLILAKKKNNRKYYRQSSFKYLWEY